MRDVAAVIFDLDDTLYRERRFVLSGLRVVALEIEARHGVPAAAAFQHLQAAFRRGPRADVLQAACRRMGLPVRRVPDWVALIRGHRPALRLPRDSARVLAHLRAEGRRIGVLTNGAVETQVAKVRALGLAAFVDGVVYADQVMAGGKPHPACFEAIRAVLGVPASRCAHVGDHPVNDVAGADAAGMRAVWLSRHGAPHPAAAAVIRTIVDVPQVLVALETPHATAC